MGDTIARCKRLARQPFFLTGLAVLSMLLALLMFYFERETHLAGGFGRVAVSPDALTISSHVAIFGALLLFLETISLFLISFARMKVVRWHMLSLLPAGLGVWLLLLAQRVQQLSHEIYYDNLGWHHGMSPLFYEVWHTQVVSTITDIHTLGVTAAGFTILLLLLAWLERRLASSKDSIKPVCSEIDLLKLAR